MKEVVMKRTVEDVMTRSVVVVRDSAPFKEMVRLMDEYRVTGLPVVDGAGRLIGMVTEADLLLKEEYASSQAWRAHGFRWRRHRADRSKARGLVAAQLMTSPAISVEPKASLARAAQLMHERGVKRLPVVSDEGKILGIVSRADLLRVFLRRDQEIAGDVLDGIVKRTLWIDPSSVRVSVKNGVVTLGGRLERRSLVDLLVEMVQGSDGVVGVENRLSFEFDVTRSGPRVGLSNRGCSFRSSANAARIPYQATPCMFSTSRCPTSSTIESRLTAWIPSCESMATRPGRVG